MENTLQENKKSKPLIVFVHIPKTAGSTINHILSSSGMKGQDHIQNWLDKTDDAKNIISKSDWISGHINAPQMRSFVCNLTTRHLRFFSTFRDPLAQITSHYNWLIEIFHRGGNFYNALPPRIKEISENIRGSDNSKPENIINQLLMAPGLFLNQQSRVLIGEDVTKMTEDEILDRMKYFEYIATEDHLSQLTKAMTGTSIDHILRKNSSQYHFDPDVFRSSEIQKFLEKHHSCDKRIHSILVNNGGFFSAKTSYSITSLNNS